MKKRITTYTFDASEKTITFGFTPEVEGFLLITNIVDNIIIYNFSEPTLGGSVTGSVLTLTYDTSLMSDTDELMIMYDDGVETVGVTQSGTWDEVGINDSGNSITVDGAVTADTGLDQPLTDTQLRASSVPVDLGVNNDVTVTSGAITETNSAAIKTAVETIDNAISGTEMQVDVVSMPTATVEATDLDIRDLTNASDSVAIYGSDDGGTTKRIIKTDSGGSIQVDLEVANVTVNNGSGASAVNIQDGGNSITIDGTVTANAGTNLNTSALALESGGNLASIKTNTDKIPSLGQALEAASTPVVLPAAQITTLTPPAAITGFATSAKQDTIIGHIDGIEGAVDGVEGLLTTIDEDTSNISTKIDTVAGAVSGTEMQVDVLTMPTTTVNGTVTANLSAVDNAVLDNIDTNTDYGTVVGGGTEATALRVTIANNSTGVVSIDDNGGSLTVDGSVGVSSIAAGDNNIGNVDIVTMPNVTIGSALPAGTNAIGKLSANSGVDIGDVDVTSLPNTLVDDAAFTIASSVITPIGCIADEASTDSVNEGDAGIPRMTLDRKQIVSIYPNATGEGLNIFRSIDLDESEEDVKTSAGKLFGWHVYNNNAATLYLKFYNATAANTTVGTTTPIMTVPIPAGSAANVEFTNGIAFSTALCAAVTTGVADNNTGAPSANDFVANIFYK